MSANHPLQTKFCRSKVIFSCDFEIRKLFFLPTFQLKVWLNSLWSSIHQQNIPSKSSFRFLHITHHVSYYYVYLVLVPYSGKLSREKTFVNFAVLWLYAKVFSAKFGAWCPLGLQKRAICESFLRKNHIFHQFMKVFSLKSFPLYGISGHKIILKTQKQGMNIASMETYNF